MWFNQYESQLTDIWGLKAPIKVLLKLYWVKFLATATFLLWPDSLKAQNILGVRQAFIMLGHLNSDGALEFLI